MKLAVYVRDDLYTGSLDDLALALIRYGMQRPDLSKPDSVEFYSVVDESQLDVVMDMAATCGYPQSCWANDNDEFPILVVGPIENDAMDKLTEGLSSWVP